MRLRPVLRHESRIGCFEISVDDDGRFHPVFDDESLGSYHRLSQATEDLAHGHTFSIASGIDTATLGLPEDPAEWERVNGTE